MTKSKPDNANDDSMTYEEARKGIRTLNIQAAIYCILALLFIIYGFWQWYDLYQIETGSKSGSISSIMYMIYKYAGKWGVAGFYWVISIWIGYMSYHKFKIQKEVKKEIFGK